MLKYHNSLKQKMKNLFSKPVIAQAKFIYNINHLAQQLRQHRQEQGLEGREVAAGRTELSELREAVLKPRLRDQAIVIAKFKADRPVAQADINQLRADLIRFYPNRNITPTGRMNRRIVRIYEEAIQGVVQPLAAPVNTNAAPTATDTAQGLARGAEAREVNLGIGELIDLHEANQITRKSPEAYALQKALIDLGYNTNGYDGIIGNATRTAIRQYQVLASGDNNAAAEPVAPEAESGQERLNRSEVGNRINSLTTRLSNNESLSSTEIRTLQKYLTALATFENNPRFDPKGVDGDPGDDTNAAIAAYTARYQPFLNHASVPWMTGVYR